MQATRTWFHVYLFYKGIVQKNRTHIGPLPRFVHWVWPSPIPLMEEYGYPIEVTGLTVLQSGVLWYCRIHDRDAADL